MFILAMINQSHKLNDTIPCMELIFYRMFMSPLTTMDDRKGHDKGDHLLVGNLFKGSVGDHGYKSLMETL